MTVDLQKSLNGLLLLLTVCFGLLTGLLAADWLGLLMAPQESGPAVARTEPARVKTYRLEDFNDIVKRNLFDSTAAPITTDALSAVSKTETKSVTPATARSSLKLLGTVAGGPEPLAVIQSGENVEVFRLGDPLPGGLSLTGIERDRVEIKSDSGEKTTLELVVETSPRKATARTQARTSPRATSKIVEVGDNRWEIPREEADKARSNLNALLKTARMVPKIEQGETVGFTIVNIKAGTFLDLLGLKVGDVLVQINEVELNSPEKALQIFQQVREANNITLGLLRNGSRQTFEYTID